MNKVEAILKDMGATVSAQVEAKKTQKATKVSKRVEEMVVSNLPGGVSVRLTSPLEGNIHPKS